MGHKKKFRAWARSEKTKRKPLVSLQGSRYFLLFYIILLTMKGGIKTIPESDRVQFTATLRSVRDAQPGGDTEFKFPSTLSSAQRAFIHGLATKYGLNSKSFGKGESRALTVSQPSLKSDASDENCSFPQFCPSTIACTAIREHCSRFPPSIEQIEDVLRGEICSVLSKPKRSMHSVRFSANPERWTAAQTTMTSNPGYGAILKGRQKLPAWNYRNRVVEMVSQEQVSLISGETGCGKTTQVPQFLLDDQTLGPTSSIICTQPRRISAMSVAERIAHERCEQVGASVGYAVRAKAAHGGQLNFVTPGLLLRRLGSDPMLTKYNVVIIDEVHEQDKYSEFLLILLRRLLPQRPDLRVILMSATLRADVFASYFNGCPRLDIGVSVFPVTTYFLEDALINSNFKGLGQNKQSFSEPLIDWGEDQADDALSKLWSADTTLSTSPFPMTNNAAAIKPNQAQGTDLVECSLCGLILPSVDALGEHIALCFGEPASPPKHRVISPEMLSEDSARKSEVASVLNRYLAQCGDEDEVDLKLVHHLLKHVVNIEREASFGLGPGGGGGQSKKTRVKTGKRAKNQCQWTEVVDPASGDIYYWDQRSGETLWEKPNEEDPPPPGNTGQDCSAVLVFLPGWNEISALKSTLDADTSLRDILVLPLHSGVPLAEQRKVFQRSRPGIIKVVLATNIAETSLTIEDIAYVIDSGRSKEQSYDCHMRIQVVRSGWVSKASARQRRGRAGRTRRGTCWHLFSKQRHDNALEEYKTSELLRTPLEELVLQAKHLDLAPGCGLCDSASVFGFLGSAVHPPNPTSIANAVELLTQLGALGGDEELTKLGSLLASLPVEPRVGKMLLWAQFFGMAQRAPSLAASMSSKSVFTIPLRGQKPNRATQLSNLNIRSDQLANLYTIEAVMSMPGSSRRRWCEDRAVSATVAASAQDLAQQINNEMRALPIGPPVVPTKDNSSALSALVGIALYPNIARRLFSEVNFSTNTGRKCKLSTQSVNKSSKALAAASTTQYEVIGFNDLTQGRSNFIANDSTQLNLLPLFFMSASVDVEFVSEEMAVMTVDGWMKLQCSRDLTLQIAVISRRLRDGFSEYISCGKKRSTLSPEMLDAAKTVALILQDDSQT